MPEDSEGEVAQDGSTSLPSIKDDDDVKRFGDMLERLAFHISGRIDYAERRRASLATAASAIVAAGIATLAFAKGIGSLAPALNLLAIGLIVTGLLALVVYFRQTNFRYPFITAEVRDRPWKWFYRDALVNVDALGAGWYTIQTPASQLSSARAFNDGWEPFAKRYETLADARVDAYQNLRQVYLLHINEKYKNRFLTDLRNVLYWGIAIAATLFLVAVIVVGVGSLTAKTAPATYGHSSTSSGHHHERPVRSTP